MPRKQKLTESQSGYTTTVYVSFIPYEGPDRTTSKGSRPSTPERDREEGVGGTRTGSDLVDDRRAPFQVKEPRTTSFRITDTTVSSSESLVSEGRRAVFSGTTSGTPHSRCLVSRRRTDSYFCDRSLVSGNKIFLVGFTTVYLEYTSHLLGPNTVHP